MWLMLVDGGQDHRSVTMQKFLEAPRNFSLKSSVYFYFFNILEFFKIISRNKFVIYNLQL